MVDQVPELFLQNNLLSEDDWGGSLSHLVDLSDLTSSDSINNSPASDFCIEDGGRFQSDFCGVNNLGLKDGNIYSSESSPSVNEDCDFVDELLQDLLQSKSSASPQNNIADDVLLQQVTSEDYGLRRYSTHTSSSSAYSSCSDSGTPSPSDQFSDHGSCSSIDFHDQESIVVNPSAVNIPNEIKCQQPKETISQTNSLRKQTYSQSIKLKSKQNSKTSTIDCIKNLKETDLDRAVRLACEETNRLLRLHRSLSSGKSDSDSKVVTSTQNNSNSLTNSNKLAHQDSQGDLLRSLCEETILDNPPSQRKNPKTKGAGTSTSNRSSPSKSQKRKASSLQNAIDRLHTANKTLCLSSQNSHQPTPVEHSIILNQNAISQPQSTRPVHLESINVGAKEPCYIVTQPQQRQPLPTAQKVTLERNTSPQTYTITPVPPQSGTPIQLYIKQESPTYQSTPVVGGFFQSPSQNVLSNQKVYVTTSTCANSNVTSGPNISIVKPEQLLCNNGQTIVIQQPQQQSSTLLKQVNISNMKPGPEPMLLSQSDLSRLAAQGVIKFPATNTSNKKVERNLMPVTDESKMRLKNDFKKSQETIQKSTIPSTICDILPADAAGVINGTSVFVNGANNQPQRGELDVKALKRHQRMIKNRASACESRQRRKEYLKTLEDQVSEVAEENKGLRDENDCLKARVRELEIENHNLRNIINLTQAKQKKAACLLMLMLFVGINCSPIGFLGIPSHSDDPLATGYAGDGLTMPAQSSIRSGRHLLSIISENDSIEDAKTARKSNLSSNKLKLDPGDKGLILPDKKESYWMDDLVQEYKDKHLENFLRLLSETTSNSVKRMLRRKLKEELGILIPLPVPRNRRIAYTPRVTRPKVTKDSITKSATRQDEKTNITPNISPLLKNEIKMPTSLPQPCERPNAYDQFPAFNETETIRVNDDLTQWAKRYSVDRQEKAKKVAQNNKLVEKKKVRNTKSPSSRYEEFENSTSTNEIALYTRPNKKFDDFFEAIKRRNDTFYVVSLNRDHLLLPASVQNTSSRMKMALVMPAITAKGGKSHDHLSEEYETMIHIECEVLTTRMFELKRKDVPDYLNISPTIKTIDNASNDTISKTNSDSPSKNPTSNSNLSKRKRKSSNITGLEKRKKKVEREKTQEQKNQEEDAFVSEVADSDPFHKVPTT